MEGEQVSINELDAQIESYKNQAAEIKHREYYYSKQVEYCDYLGIDSRILNCINFHYMEDFLDTLQWHNTQSQWNVKEVIDEKFSSKMK